MTELGQFIRAETKPLVRSSLTGKSKGRGKRRKGWNAKDIRDEAERRPNAIPHIEKPEPPIVLYGVTPTEVLKRIAVEISERKKQLLADNAAGKKIKRIRKDQRVQIAGVVSYPVDWNSVRKSSTETATHIAWNNDVIEFLRDHYAAVGGELVSVLEHTDEPFPHLHFYVLPIASTTFNARQIHDGWRLKLDARANHLSKDEEEAAYSRGNTIFQDAFYLKVSQKYGHVRHKAKRPRVARNIYASEKRQLARDNQLLARSRLITDQEEKRLVKKAADLEAQKGILISTKDKLAAQAAANTKAQATLDMREAHIRRQEGELAAAISQQKIIERSLVVERSKAVAAGAAFQEATKDILLRAKSTLADIKASISQLVKTRDRYRNPQNAAEAQSFSVARSTIETLERIALTFDTFVNVDLTSAEPDLDVTDLKDGIPHGASRPGRSKP